MRHVLSVAWFAARAVYDDMLVLAGVGTAWIAMALLPPVLVLRLTTLLALPLTLAIPLNLLSLILLPPSTAAVYHLTAQVARQKRIEFSYLGQGLKTYFKISWAIAAIVAISGSVSGFSLLFYWSNSQNWFFLAAGFIFIWIMAFWVGAQVYLWPLAVSQEGQHLWIVLENAGLLTLSFPFFTLAIVILIILVTALSILVPFLAVLWMPFVSTLCNRALIVCFERVEQIRQAQRLVDEATQQEKERPN